MLTKSEILFCSTAAIGLMAFSVANHIDPAVATRNFAVMALQATVHGIKTGAHFLYLAGKASAIVFGSYAALKVAVATGKAIKRSVKVGFEMSLQEENEEEMRFEEEETPPQDEADLSEYEIEVVEPNFTIRNWKEAEYDEDEDEDYEDDDELDVIENITSEDPLTGEEMQLLLADQKRVIFQHGAIKMSPLLPIENTHQKRPYCLRPRVSYTART